LFVVARLVPDRGKPRSVIAVTSFRAALDDK
jgi:hypothetical protein